MRLQAPGEMLRRLCAGDAARLSTQHFLKRRAVFLQVLVYAGRSAFRFPDARHVKPSSFLEGTMAKKAAKKTAAKKSKTVKTAAKKTAKKTKKVAKKKK
jgi:hypothetical protein